MKDFILSLKLYFLWLLLLLTFYLFGHIIFGNDSGISFYSLANWDGRHFLDIARFGYTNPIQYAFFPLYPLVVKCISMLTGLDYLSSGLITNFLSTFGIIYLFTKLLKESKSKVKTILFFLIFPTSFYLISFYTESLFLLLVLSSFFYLKKKNYYLSALFASLSSMTRISGVAVIAAVLFEIYLSKKSLKEKLVSSIISVSGLIIYCIYLFYTTGNPFYFIISELEWDRSVALPGLNILTAINFLATYGLKPESFTILSDIFFTVLGIGLAIRTWKYLPPSYSIYTFLSLYLPLATALILSMPRFVLVIFPLFIVLAEIKNKIFNLGYIIISLTLLFLYFNFFLRVIWVS